MSNPFTQAMARILEIVVQEKSYFQKHPPQLARLMQEFSTIHYASREHENKELHDWENPKYPIMELEDQVSQSYANLVYDAWVAGSRESREHRRPHPLEKKKNKTLPEIVKMCLDPKYRYHSIFPNRRQVLNYYLCVIGTGLAWNQDGFIGSAPGPSGCAMDQFEGSKTAKFPVQIRRQFTWTKDKEINRCKKILKQREAAARREQIELDEAYKYLKSLDSPKKIQEEQKEAETNPFYPLCEYSLICHIPKNAHPSFIEGAIEVCGLILSNPQESLSNQKIAKKVFKKLKDKT